MNWIMIVFFYLSNSCQLFVAATTSNGWKRVRLSILDEYLGRLQSGKLDIAFVTCELGTDHILIHYSNIIPSKTRSICSLFNQYYVGSLSTIFFANNVIIRNHFLCFLKKCMQRAWVTRRRIISYENVQINIHIFIMYYSCASS